eukprot:m.202180 g.202180  ORF g.202180 m.202180 type:complete len:91 (-) comp53833_c0_seq11:1573-1845(-)
MLQRLLDRKEIAIDARDKEGLTALMVAIVNSRMDCITALLTAGASVVMLFPNGQTMLHASAKLYNLTILQQLLDGRQIAMNARDEVFNGH